MPVLVAQDISKSYGQKTILDGVSLSIHTGQRVGLVGSNGSGKSTLARILAGLEAPDAGSVAVRRGASVAYLAQEPTLDPDATARTIVTEGLGAWSQAKTNHERLSARIAAGEPHADKLLAEQAEAAAQIERHGGWDLMHRVEEILGHLGIERPDVPARELSGGDKRRVALARILVAPPTLLILDEPSNHLDVETITWLEKYLLEEFEGALLVVTHDRYLLDRIADRTLELHRGVVHAYEGGYEAYLEAKAERLALEARTEQNRQNFLRGELEWLRRQPKARTTKQKARIQRAEAAKDARPQRAERTARLVAEASITGKTLAELRNVSVDLAGRTLVRDLDLVIMAGERIGIVGRNGTGKTTLLRTILGEISPSRGAVVIGKNTRLGYFDQHRSGLDEDASVYDNVASTGNKIELGGQPIEVRSFLERFAFDSHAQRQPVRSLSGGERARVALARMLADKHGLLILDEPTNDLDLPTLSALEEMLLEYGGSAIVVTHDRWFLDRVATSLLVFEGDGRIVRYAGGHSDYLMQKAAAVAAREEAARAAQAEAKSIQKDKPPAKTSKPKGLTWAEQREFETILDRVDAAEKEVADCEKALTDPSLYSSRPTEVPAMTRKLEEAKARAAALVARWEELEQKQSAT
ncbi:MAG: ABC-F family ATP-binding cassette domain-containing protein [Polyangiaceae bacterium]|nr:ABC-F family ATP-binding cassette domain-containing protein [Polyangiaceae bacterium]